MSTGNQRVTYYAGRLDGTVRMRNKGNNTPLFFVPLISVRCEIVKKHPDTASQLLYQVSIRFLSTEFI